jgi:hypothetical protein
MAKATPDTIVLKGVGIRKEADANGTITPGHLVVALTTGIVVHPNAAESAIAAFAVENDIAGDEIDTDYVSGDNVLYEVLPPGSEVFALVGAVVTVDDYLESAGDGTLRKQAVLAATSQLQRNSVVGRALETTSGADRCKIEVM